MAMGMPLPRQTTDDKDGSTHRAFLCSLKGAFIASGLGCHPPFLSHPVRSWPLAPPFIAVQVEHSRRGEMEEHAHAPYDLVLSLANDLALCRPSVLLACPRGAL